MPVTATSVVGAITVTATERWLLAALASVRLWVATRVCPPSAADVAFKLNVRVAGAPTASPVTVWGPIVTPAVASVRTDRKRVVNGNRPEVGGGRTIDTKEPRGTVSGRAAL